MLEVHGRRSMIVFWVASGICLSLFGWLTLDWREDFGKLWEIAAVSLMVSGVIVVGIGIWKALDKRPVLVVDGEGFLDRTSIKERRGSGWISNRIPCLPI